MTETQTDVAARLIEGVPERVRPAASVCAVPHSFDRELGSALVRQFVVPDDRAELTLTEVVGLPFVAPVEDGRWQFAATARRVLVAPLLARDKEFAKVSRFLTRYLSPRRVKARESMNGHGDLSTRQRMWERAYHQAVIDPEAAVKSMFRFGEAAVDAGREGDLRAIVHACDEREQWLQEFEAERRYFEGRLAYVLRDWKEAEQRFRYVWDRGAADPMMTATAGFLLAVVRRQCGTEAGVREAEILLRRVLKMGARARRSGREDWRRLRAKVLNSLAGTLVQRGGNRPLEEARALLDESEKLATPDQDARHRAHVLHTRGALLGRSQDLANLNRAVIELRTSLKIAPYDDHRHRAQVLNSLGHVLMLRGGRRDRVEAQRLVRRSLRLGERLRDDQHVANALYNLGLLMSESQRLGKASGYLRRSAKVWSRLENNEGEKKALRALATIMRRRGDGKEASRLLRRAATLGKQKKATR